MRYVFRWLSAADPNAFPGQISLHYLGDLVRYKIHYLGDPVRYKILGGLPRPVRQLVRSEIILKMIIDRSL